MKKSGWLWITLVVLLSTLLVILATTFNFAVFQIPEVTFPSRLFGIVMGTIGFVIVLSFTIVILVRLLREMKLNQLQNEFLARVTHELKSPIATIELMSDLIKESNLQPTTIEEQHRLWDIHDVELKRLKTEVEVLLEATRWEHKPFPPNLTVFNLESWLTKSIEHWKNFFPGVVDRKGVPLNFNVYLDSKLFDLISNNLVNNAKKFAKADGRLTIQTEFDNDTDGVTGRWRIHFIDNGYGFEPKDCKRIFKRFYRAKHSAPYAIAGTGLGLYLVKSACKALKIRVSASSPGPDHGAVFTLEGIFTR